MPVRCHEIPVSLSLTLTKFDVAERQLNQAIQLFFDQADPVSVHTLAEAAGQVLYDIREQFGGISKIRDADNVSPECRKEWLESLARSRNFFKHADRDPSDTHEFKEEFNHISLFDAIAMYMTAKRRWTPETIVFVLWFSLTYPKVIKPNTDFATAIRHSSQNWPTNVNERIVFASKLIRTLRNSPGQIPGITLEYGAPTDQ